MQGDFWGYFSGVKNVHCEAENMVFKNVVMSDTQKFLFVILS
jgi:hypothetical protein